MEGVLKVRKDNNGGGEKKEKDLNHGCPPTTRGQQPPEIRESTA